jgi:hypothetical protein
MRRFHDPALLELAELADSLDATMIVPLIALAFAAGAARTAFGIGSAQKQGQSERDQIKRAYQISKRRMNQSEAYIRQGSNESLNARGVLNAGSNTGRPSAITDAYAAGDKSAATNATLAAQLKKGNTIGAVKTLGKNGGNTERVYGTEEARMAADAERGKSGDASTLSGQVNSDLSGEFYGEQQDLFSQRQAGINASKRGQSEATAGAVGAGIDTGTSVYNAGSMIKGAFGAAPTQAAVPAPTAGQPGYTPPPSASWFGGYDPTDPLGIAKKGRDQLNDSFNVQQRKG